MKCDYRKSIHNAIKHEEQQTMIDRFMKKHQLTQYRLAKLLGVTQTTVARWRKSGPVNKKMVKLTLIGLDMQLKAAKA